MENTRQQRGSKEQKIRHSLLRRIGIGRTAIILLLAFTLLNQLLFWLKVNYHFLFSAAVPYYLNRMAREFGAAGVTPLKVIAGLVSPIYFVAFGACWLLSAQRRDIIKTAMLLYCADTLLLVVVALGFIEDPMTCLLELLVHLIGVIILYDANRSARQLRRMSKKKKTRPVTQQPEHSY